MRSFVASVAAMLALAACTTPRDANAPASATSTSMLSCREGAPPPIVLSRHAGEHPRAAACANVGRVDREAQPPRSGPSSETAAVGQQLFDAGRYSEAILPLRQTADALTGDEKAQRQVARLRLAIALLRTGEERQGAAILETIAVDPLDGAHLAMLAWLTDEAPKQPALIHLLAGFDDLDLECFRSARGDLHARAAYLIGRERFERALYAEATFFFAQVDGASVAAADAGDCMQIIGAKTEAALRRAEQ